MDNDSEILIRAALKQGYITSRQAEMLRDEMDMFPGQNLGTLMVRRNMVTNQQLALLRDGGQAKVANSPAPSGAGDMPSSVRPGGNGPLGAGAPPALQTNVPQPQPRVEIKSLAAPKVGKPNAKLADYLKAARESGSSDLHICTGRPPFVRQAGRLVYLDEPALTPEQTKAINTEGMDAHQLEVFTKDQQIDFSLWLDDLGRHRCNVFVSRLGIEGAYRIVRSTVPTIDELGLPDVCKKLTEFHQGLVLVTGPCSSGKTTTCAALLDYINEQRTDHIISVEDPIEYVLTPKNCQVTQREVGPHTLSFGNALRGALRQDPDVILVGEMRDLETTSIAISAAETGHLVLGTLHTNTAIRAVARIMDLYPPAQRAQICVMVSESMRGIIAQQLVPKRDHSGLALALELLIFHSGVSAVVREGKTSQLPSLMQSGKRYGMKLMDESLMDLFKAGTISGRTAYQRADNKVVFEPLKEQD
jgi:twitching motility protein PilT